MGWIEDLGKQRAAEAETRRLTEVKKQLEHLELLKEHDIRELERKNIENQRPSERREYWQKSKNYFEESGLRRMIGQLVSVGAAERVSEDENNLIYEYYPWGKENRRSKGDTLKESFNLSFSVIGENGNYSVITDGFGHKTIQHHYGGVVTISTDVDGDISFNRRVSHSGGMMGEVITRKKWKEDRSNIENALKTACRYPDSSYDVGRGDSITNNQTDFSH